MKRECAALLERLGRQARWLLPATPLLLALMTAFMILLEKSASRVLRSQDYNLTTGCPLNTTIVCNDATRLWVYDEQRFAVLALCAIGWSFLLLALAALLTAGVMLARWAWRERYELSMLTTPEPEAGAEFEFEMVEGEEDLTLDSLEDEDNVTKDRNNKGHKTD